MSRARPAGLCSRQSRWQNSRCRAARRAGRGRRPHGRRDAYRRHQSLHAQLLRWSWSSLLSLELGMARPFRIGATGGLGCCATWTNHPNSETGRAGFNVRLEGFGRRRVPTSWDSESDRTCQHSRSYLGPAIKRWIPQRSINVLGQVRPPPRGRLLGRQLMEGCLGEDFGINPAGLSQLARTPQIRRPIWNPVERGPLHPGGSCKGQLGRRCHEYRYWSSCIDRRIPSGRTGLNSDGWAIAGRGQVGALVPSITARVVSRRWASPTTCREPCKFQHWKGEETTRWTALRGN